LYGLGFQDEAPFEFIRTGFWRFIAPMSRATLQSLRTTAMVREKAIQTVNVGMGINDLQIN